MKKKLGAFLRKIGCYNSIVILYKILKKPSLWYSDFDYRVNGLPDGYPTPSFKLISLVVSHASPTRFYKEGKDQMSKIISLLTDASIDINNFKRILDFGCGCGRLIRHLSFLKNTELYGTDYNELLIKWCQNYLPFGKFQVNEFAPPLKYNNNMFDFIYLRSVFTHLDGDSQQAWMTEFHRILTNDGILLFTTHGEQYVNILSEEEQIKYRKGELVIRNMETEGTNYAASFQSPEFVKKHLLKGFELISYVPRERSLWQDAYIVRRLNYL